MLLSLVDIFHHLWWRCRQIILLEGCGICEWRCWRRSCKDILCRTRKSIWLLRKHVVCVWTSHCQRNVPFAEILVITEAIAQTNVPYAEVVPVCSGETWTKILGGQIIFFIHILFFLIKTSFYFLTLFSLFKTSTHDNII